MAAKVITLHYLRNQEELLWKLGNYGRWALEVFKSLNDLNPSYTKELFKKNISATRKPSNLSLNLAKTPTAPKSKKLRATYLELLTLRNNE